MWGSNEAWADQAPPTPCGPDFAVCGACLGPREERLEGLLLPGLGVSLESLLRAWTLQEGQLHQTHVWLERACGPAFLLD